MGDVIRFSDYIKTQSFKTELDELAKSLDILTKQLNGLITDTKKVNESIKSQTVTQTQASKAIKDTNTNVTKLTNLEKERIKIETQTKQVLAKSLAVEEQKNRTLIKGKTALQQRNQVLKNQAKIERLTSVEGQKLNKTLQQQRGELSKLQGRGGGFVKSLKGMLTGFLGITAVIYGTIRAIGSIVKKNVEFQKSLSSLSAITGLTGKDLEFFAIQAKITSTETLQGANDIVKAYELVGSIRPELLKNKEALAEVTKQSIILSEATGGKLGLEEAAKAVAGTLNQFSLSADDAARAANALAAGSKYGSATADLVTESFKNFGAVADGANISMEQSVALTEVLAEKQIVGSDAGTALRGTIIRLQAAGVGYASGQFNINDALDETNKLINSQKSNYEKDALAQKIFGQRNIVTGKILLGNVDRFNELTDAVTGTTTALEQQAIQNDNVSANWKRLTNIIGNAFLSIKGTGFLNEIVKGLITVTQKIGEFRNAFIENFNDLIRQSAIFRAIFVTVTKSVRLSIKSIVEPTMILVEAFTLVGKVIKDALTGNWDEIGKNVKDQFNVIKNRVIDLGMAYADTGKEIAAAFRGDDIDKYLIKQKDLTETISGTTQGVLDFTSAQKEEVEAAEAVAEATKKEKDEVKDLAAELKKAEQERKERVKLELDDIENLFERDVYKQKERLLKKEINEDEFAKEILNIQIESMMNQLDVAELTAQEKFDIENEIINKRIELEKIFTDKLEEEEDKRKEMAEARRDAMIDIGNGLFEFNASLNERKLADLEAQKEYELSLVGDNEAAKGRIEADFAKKSADIKRKQAIADKAQGIFNAAINTAIGITSALSLGPIGIVLAVLIGILGAIQIATIAAKPIPKFAKGTDPGGLPEDTFAEFGEAGPEIVNIPGQRPFLAKKKTRALLPRGTDIIPNYETEQILSGQGGITERQFDKLIHAAEKKPTIINHSLNITERGFEAQTEKGTTKIKWLNKYMGR